MQVAAAKQLIQRRFAAVHGASARPDYPDFLSVTPPSASAPAAVLGLRYAASGPLFLETYLDQPIEQAVSYRLERIVPREAIVEIGGLASEQKRATVTLWARTARDLAGEAEVAVAVLTAPLRLMFARLGLDILEIADADPARLGARAADWGRYYELAPKVCLGLIGPARARLAAYAGDEA
ncbi:thermostable hemolysin [Sphingomonas astaxanthinifaciens]|uniref:Thermostable hemolysin n=1 Tax=Sphingomonas astaxanthinifaciens DSM 22298 TaxID=1123267 RepID=A0ABQ5Z2W1_9SPHN|nr:thermostable hemolysin [Sphingomonas astaxanthinifaciens]GLR46350.1 hypothetical protein GCM10007925_00610 [Sphingomonas astaxanthinifaciens DSM 22298]